MSCLETIWNWFSTLLFPGRDGGRGNTPLRRYLRPVGSPEEFQEEVAELWKPTRDPAIEDMPEPDSVTSLYQGWSKCDVAAYPGIPYITVCTIPRWQSRLDDYGDQAFPTAWLALHSIDEDLNGDGAEGDFVAGYSIEHFDADEPGMMDAGAPTDPWVNIYLSEVNMYVPEGFTNGAFEILWSGGGIGYGRYVVGDVEIPTELMNWQLF